VAFVSHVPNLPTEIWGGLTGVRDLQSAYSRFETRMVVRARAFVGQTLTERRRPEPRTLPLRQVRARRRTAIARRPAR
jgi:hypothetical protein